MSLFYRTQRKIFWRKFVSRLFWVTIDFQSSKKNTMEVNGAPELLCFPHSSEYLPLCSAEQRRSYRSETTWGWVNDNRIFIFGWTIPLSTQMHQNVATVAERAQCATNRKNTCKLRKQLPNFFNARAANAHYTTKKRNSLLSNWWRCFLICWCFFYLHVFSEVAARWALSATLS